MSDNSGRRSMAQKYKKVPVKSKLDRRHFCIFCKKLVKLPRHLEQVHSDEKEVQVMCRCEKGKLSFLPTSWLFGSANDNRMFNFRYKRKKIACRQNLRERRF